MITRFTILQAKKLGNPVSRAGVGNIAKSQNILAGKAVRAIKPIKVNQMVPKIGK